MKTKTNQKKKKQNKLPFNFNLAANELNQNLEHVPQCYTNLNCKWKLEAFSLINPWEVWLSMPHKQSAYCSFFIKGTSDHTG